MLMMTDEKSKIECECQYHEKTKPDSFVTEPDFSFFHFIAPLLFFKCVARNIYTVQKRSFSLCYFYDSSVAY